MYTYDEQEFKGTTQILIREKKSYDKESDCFESVKQIRRHFNNDINVRLFVCLESLKNAF